MTIEMEAPSEYLCPLTLDVMRDPVMSKYGQSFERTEILQWLRSGHGVCPLSRRPLSLQDLVTNHGLRMKITDWRRTNFGGGDGDKNNSMVEGGGIISPNDDYGDYDGIQNQMIYGFITLPAKEDNLTDRTIDDEEDLFYLRLAALRLSGGGVAVVATGLQQQQQELQQQQHVQLQSANINATAAAPATAAAAATGSGGRRRRRQPQRRNSTGSQRQLVEGRQQRQSSRSIRRPFRGLRNLFAGPSP